MLIQHSFAIWASFSGIRPDTDIYPINQYMDNIYFHGFMQERLNSIANALELRLSCTNPLINVPIAKATQVISLLLVSIEVVVTSGPFY